MIIQCEKCQTRFRLDDSRVTDKGVKVRCTKCKHVFRVHKEGSHAEPFVPGAELTAFTPVDGQGDASAAPLDDRQFAAGDAAYAPVGFDSSEDTSDVSADDLGVPGAALFDASAMSFESDELDVLTTETAEPAASGEEVDFSGFDFGEALSEPDSAPLSTVSAADFIDGETESVVTHATPRKEALQGLDFSDDDMFGAVVQPVPEESGTAISFDFEGDDSFAESMDMGGHDSSGKSGKLFSLDTTGDTPFSLDEIDFGDELTSVAVQQVNPEDLKPSQEMLFAPLAEAQVKSTSAESAPPRGIDVDEQHELPPLSIASRRKQSPLFGALIAVVAVLVISVLGYIAYSSFSTAKSVTPESGSISVRGVKAVFIDNDAAGELLVISGEALNEFPKPRAALQVKVSVFDATGQSIATKSAYGGNPLTEEQLASLPLDKIEAAMANQFGDSLANMEVAPGKAIPFVVVLANLPGGAIDFAVQPAGSTVATGKQ
ncbi:MAG: DUF3426 domain-containing protein [Desulfuromonadaceae bacterium]